MSKNATITPAVRRIIAQHGEAITYNITDDGAGSWSVVCDCGARAPESYRTRDAALEAHRGHVARAIAGKAGA